MLYLGGNYYATYLGTSSHRHIPNTDIQTDRHTNNNNSNKEDKEEEVMNLRESRGP